MVAERDEVVEVFSETLTVIVALLDPEDLFTVHQLISLVTVHERFDVMVNVLLPAEESKSKLVGLTDKVGSGSGVGVGTTFCVT